MCTILIVTMQLTSIKYSVQNRSLVLTLDPEVPRELLGRHDVLRLVLVPGAVAVVGDGHGAVDLARLGQAPLVLARAVHVSPVLEEPHVLVHRLTIGG